MSENFGAGQALTIMWLNYQQAFDSVPHKWLIKSLEPAKVPTISALKELITKWTTDIHLQGNEQLVETKLIHYLRGIFQGDSLSVLLFILCVNSLLFLLNKLQGYHIGTNRHQDQNIANLFFVEDLKLYATTMSQMRQLLDQVTRFSRDIGVKFGESKCTYIITERGKIIEP